MRGLFSYEGMHQSCGHHIRSLWDNGWRNTCAPSSAVSSVKRTRLPFKKLRFQVFSDDR